MVLHAPLWVLVAELFPGLINWSKCEMLNQVARAVIDDVEKRDHVPIIPEIRSKLFGANIA